MGRNPDIQESQPATPGVSRRVFVGLATGGAVAAAAGPIDAAMAPPDAAVAAGAADDITAATIAEAAKLHAVSFPPASHAELASRIPGQVAAIRAVRAVAKPLELPPALGFDPRLPGAVYPDQPDGLTLVPADPGPVPARDDDLAFAPVTALARWLRSGRLTSTRLTEIYLDRIRRLAGPLHCYITVTDTVARAEAARADRELANGHDRGPLHGIPYGIKDVFDTAGIPTTWGAEPFRNRVPVEDAAIVARLRTAGAVLLGKLATGALANGATWFGGQCRNPWNPEEPAGGSSTGSGSATAAGLCGFSIGTDSLGSILNPADRCGVVGLRATYGRISTRGAMPLTPSLDRIGPITRTVEDAALVLAAIHGPDAGRPRHGFRYDGTADVRGLRVGYSPGWFERIGFGPGASVPAKPAHRAALDALRGLGVTLVEVELPPRPYFALINNLMVEAAAIYEELTLSGRDEELPVDNASAWPMSWRQARLLSAVDYLQFERLRRLVMEDFHALFGRVHAVFGPTYGSFELLMATNFTGHPGLTLRAGLDQSPTRGLGPMPLDPRAPARTITQNVAFHGRLYDEGTILGLGRALEAALGVWHHRPGLG